MWERWDACRSLQRRQLGTAHRGRECFQRATEGRPLVVGSSYLCKTRPAPGWATFKRATESWTLQGEILRTWISSTQWSSVCFLAKQATLCNVFEAESCVITAWNVALVQMWKDLKHNKGAPVRIAQWRLGMTVELNGSARKQWYRI